MFYLLVLFASLISTNEMFTFTAGLINVSDRIYLVENLPSLCAMTYTYMHVKTGIPTFIDT